MKLTALKQLQDKIGRIAVGNANGGLLNLAMINLMIHNRTINIALILVLLLICTFGTKLSAQILTDSVRGKVSDQYGKPLAGVTVNSENGKNGTSTNFSGEYAINVTDKSKFLIFSYVGYLRQQVTFGNLKQGDIKLQPDPFSLDEVIQLGYTSQRRREISGSVATVSGTELERAPVANLTQTLPGRLAGLFTHETYSELSRANTNTYVRGISSGRQLGPLVIIDGVVNSYNSNQSLDYISAGEIESITLLKDASTEALYGIQGANGVMVVTTKRGKKGDLQVSGRVDQSLQQATTIPTFYTSAEYAEMRNQAASNDGRTQLPFTTQQIESFRSGQNPDLYPNNNWYNRYMKNFALMERVGVNLTGGNDRIQYFTNLNIMHQGGQFKTDQTNYDANANNVWVNYRSNIDMTLNRYLKGFLRLAGNIKRERSSGPGNAAVYSSIFDIPPTMYGPVTPQITDPVTGQITDPGGKVVTTGSMASPTYGMLNRTGYVRSTVTNITSQFGLDLDMSFLTKGLSLSGLMAYQTNSVGTLSTTQDYERWTRIDDWSVLNFVKKGSKKNTPLAYGKSASFYYNLNYDFKLSYSRSFGKHQIDGTAYMFRQNLSTADNQSPGLLPYNRLSSGLEASYEYNNRYFAKFDLGYSGSEQYARNSRYVATPAVSAAWVVSNEDFLRENKWLNNLKLRASYGKTANDQNGRPRFSYLDNVTVTGGGPIGYLQYMINELQVGNPFIQAEISTKQNYGIDLGLFNALSLSVDVFRENMNNMIVSSVSTVPLYQGVPLNYYPSINAGTFKNEGFEISANYKKPLSKNLTVFAGGMLSYAKNTVVNSFEPLKSTDYAYRNLQDGYSVGQQFGYLVDYSNGNGFFNSQAEITNSHLTYGFGQIRVGDLKYRDLNNDHIIDERDKAPIGNGAIPRITYSFSGGFSYKAFDLNMLFYGVGKYSSLYSGTGIWETAFDGVYGALNRDAWTPERYQSGAKITAPALSYSKSVSQEANDYYSYDLSYLRLKNVELGYTLPTTVSKAISVNKIRCVFSGQNLITWDNMKSKDFGPEGGGYTSFPVYRVYNLGVNVTF